MKVLVLEKKGFFVTAVPYLIEVAVKQGNPYI